MNLTKTEIDIGNCIYHGLANPEMQYNGKRLKMINSNQVEIAMTKRNNGSYKVSLTYRGETTSCTLKASDFCRPRAWEAALRHRPGLVKFLKNVKFIDYGGYNAHIYNNDAYCDCTPVLNLWSSVTNRLCMAISASRLIMDVYMLNRYRSRDYFVRWISPTLALHWKKDAENTITLVNHRVALPPSVMHFSFNTSHTDDWENALIDELLSWLITDKFNIFAKLFVTHVYCASIGDRVFARKEIPDRFLERFNLTIPNWLIEITDTSISDAQILVVGRDIDGKVHLLPLTKHGMHAPIFTSEDLSTYAKEYISG